MNGKTLEEFLEELSQLTRKYGILIDGCGCCGSPYLVAEEREEIVAERLTWKEGKYVVNT